MSRLLKKKDQTLASRDRRNNQVRSTLLIARILCVNFDYVITLKCSCRTSSKSLQRFDIHRIYELQKTEYVLIYEAEGNLEDKRNYSFEYMLRLLEKHQYTFESTFKVPITLNIKNEEFIKRRPKVIHARGNKYIVKNLYKMGADILYDSIIKIMEERRLLEYFHLIKANNLNIFKENKDIWCSFDQTVTEVLTDNAEYGTRFLEDVCY